MFKKATKQAAGGGTKMSGPLLDAGAYPARLISIVDLGLQPGTQMYPEPKHKVQFTFELLDEFMVDEEGNELLDKPRYFSHDLSYNPDGYMGERSNIYKLYEAIDGFEKEMPELLGSLCNVTLGIGLKQDGKTKKNKIIGTASMREKDKAKQPEAKGEFLFFSTTEPDMKVFGKLTSGSEWAQQEKIKSCLNMGELDELREALGIDLDSCNEGDVDENVQEEDNNNSNNDESSAEQSAAQGGATDEEDIFD